MNPESILLEIGKAIADRPPASPASWKIGIENDVIVCKPSKYSNADFVPLYKLSPFQVFLGPSSATWRKIGRCFFDYINLRSICLKVRDK